MNLTHYYWYFKSVIPIRICDDIVRYAKSMKNKMANIGDSEDFKNLSPKNNRTVPPLDYDFVSKIKIEHPNIDFILNGGIENIDQAYSLFNKYDGVMIGRLIQNNPFSLMQVDKLFYNK